MTRAQAHKRLIAVVSFGALLLATRVMAWVIAFKLGDRKIAEFLYETLEREGLID